MTVPLAEPAAPIGECDDKLAQRPFKRYIASVESLGGTAV